MRRCLLFLCVCLLLVVSGVEPPLTAHAEFLGIKKSSEKVVLPILSPIDTVYGRQIFAWGTAPDSIQVFVYKDNDTYITYDASGAAFAAAGVDTTMRRGKLQAWYVQTISTIYGSNCNNCQLGIQVLAWYQGYPRESFGTVQVITDSLNYALALVKAYLDATVSSRSVFNAAADSVLVDGSALAATAGAISATTLGSGAISASALGGDAARKVADSLLNRDTSATPFHNAWSFAEAVQAARDTMVAHAPHGNNWASIGQATANDSLQIRRWVWDSTSWKYRESGGLAYKRVADSLKSHDGRGPKVVCVWTIDTAASPHDTLPGVAVAVQDAGMTAREAQGITSDPGIVSFTLNSGVAYRLIARAPGYAFPVSAPVTTSTNTNPDTFAVYGYRFDPGAPASPNLCRVYGWVSDLSAADVAGAVVRARVAESPLRYQNVVISPYERSTTTDTNGYWYLDLFPSAALNPASTRYEFEIQLGSGAVLRRRVAVPQAAEWLLSW